MFLDTLIRDFLASGLRTLLSPGPELVGALGPGSQDPPCERLSWFSRHGDKGQPVVPLTL